jgi:hypothetical protein
LNGHVFLNPKQVVAHLGEHAPALGTLRNWRSSKIGPAFIKRCGKVLYPLDMLIEWANKGGK